VRAYRETLGRFLRALVEDGVPLTAAAVRGEDVYRYLGRYSHLTLDTRHRYFREVRCFFNWLAATGQITTTPFAHLRNVRLPRQIVGPFAPGDVQALLAACPASAAGLRDRATSSSRCSTRGCASRSWRSSRSTTSTSRGSGCASSTRRGTSSASCPSRRRAGRCCSTT
jgi:hypothetical protein